MKINYMKNKLFIIYLSLTTEFLSGLKAFVIKYEKYEEIIK